VSYFKSIPFFGIVTVFFSFSLYSVNCSAISLQEAAEIKLRSHFTAKFPDADINIVVNSVNTQVNLRKCEKYHFSLPDKLPPGGKLSLRVTCLKPQKWVSYVKATAFIYAQVAVSKRPIPKGTRISYKDISFSRHNISQLHKGFFTSPEQIIGQTARRGIQQDRVIHLSTVRSSYLITRGDSIVIESRSGSLSVRVQGIALQNGKRGEQIKVINSKTQIELRAYVKKRGLVVVSE